MAANRDATILYIGWDDQPHNYIEKLVQYAKQTPLGIGEHHMEVLHDDWCAWFKGGRCNCHPIIGPRAGPPNSQAIGRED